MTIAWWSPVGRASRWNLPDLDHDGWSGLSVRTFRMKSHPEYTTENAVDMNHLVHVHDYFDTAQVGRVSVEGPHLKNAFDFKRMRRIAGFPIVADISLAVHLHGLGYSLVEYREHSIGLEGRVWILVTPIDGTWMEMVLVAQVRHVTHPKRAIVGLRFLPAALRTKIFVKALVDQQAKDVEQDIPIWERKRYRPRPILSRTDGEIMLFRRFCRQFYPDRPEAFATDRPRREAAAYMGSGLYTSASIARPDGRVGSFAGAKLLRPPGDPRPWTELPMAANLLLTARYQALEMVPADYKLKIDPLPKLSPDKRFKFRVKAHRFPLD